MSAFYKIILSVLVCGAALFAGYRLFRVLNEKIADSRTGWQLLAYSLLLFVTCAALFFGSFLAIALVYSFLKDV
jgi:hypothetical protein